MIRRCWPLLLLLWGSASAAPPIDAIVELLRSQALERPDEALVGQLAPENLFELLPRIDRHAELLPPAGPGTEPPSRRIGAELLVRGGRTLLAPFQGGPLERAGYPERVVLESIDDAPVAGLPVEGIATRLGDATTPLRLGLRRAPGAPLEEVRIIPEPFTPSPVESLQIDGRPLLRIRAFERRETLHFLAAAIEALGPETVLVIDLRDNPGGDLFEALDSAALFLPAGTLLATTIDRSGDARDYRAPGGRYPDRPLYLLVGPDTASAAEIFAGILQAHHRASLIGRPTHGKCRSQTEAPLPDGYRLRFTNLAVRLPDGQDCEGAGLEPSLSVAKEGLDEIGALLRLALEQ